MPSIVMTAPKKAKLVIALLAQHDLLVERTPFDGMLICKHKVDPLLRNIPYVTGIIEISDQEAEGIISGDKAGKQALIQEGAHIVVTHGDFENCHGLVRYMEGNIAMVDINYLPGRMFAVKLPLADISLPTGHNYWED